ncbi:LysR family transcriptional regulator [Roseomonas sp. JC162]|uniref:LysR family transcriptional regulator n=1 Tax=Neoroseomonas marina TaxID=1232220 RepID=A0A848EJD4_9PROT|nr:LysR family transcriptional regulator [Neoroseomonas marina]NMJ43507.1 LysR family transcriptional regulator [Neoroseomonas marina]
MSGLDARALRYFVGIVTEGSITRAAEQLNVAQPALSLQVKKLEAVLGTELLHRTARGVTPTEAGLRLLDYARDILKLMESAREELRSAASEPIGDVSLGLPQSVSMVLTVPLVETVLATMPKVRLHVVEAMTGYIPGWLRSGHLDLGMLFRSSDATGLVTRRFLDESLYVVGPPGAFPVAGRKGAYRCGSVPFSTLGGLPLIAPGRPHGLRDLVDEAARSQGVELHPIVEVDAIAPMLELTARGVGHCVLSYAVVRGAIEEGRVSAARLVDPPIRRSIFICRAADAPISRASREVEALACRLMAELVTSGLWSADLAGDATP